MAGSTVLLLSGCGVISQTGAGAISAPSDPESYNVSGVLHGGQSPIQGALVNLYVTSASASAYGSGATFIGTGTSDVDGNFTISPSATSSNCPAGQQAYITAAGGYPSGNSNLANNSVLMMAALGDCGNVNANTRVVINEVTTVAAAYALSSFTVTAASGSLYSANVGAPAANDASTATVSAASGLAHAFLNAANLASVSVGSANSQTANLSVAGTTLNGTVPNAEINTLGDILQSCVNGATGNSNCVHLFSFTPSISGTAPTNTLQAMINLARNPYPSASAMTASAGLFGLVSASPAFLPNLSSQPPDWSLAVTYTGATLPVPYYLSLDANDTVFYGSSVAATAVGLSAYGTSTPAFTAFTGSGTRGLAPDALGNLWVTTNSSNLLQYSAMNGGAATATCCYVDLWGVTIDASNNVWLADVTTTTPNISENSYNAGTPATYTKKKLTATFPTFSPFALTIDAKQNIWVAAYASSGTLAGVLPNLSANSAPSAPSYTTSGTVISPITATFASGAIKPYGVVIDASGDAWYGLTGSNTTATAGVEEVIPALTSGVITSLSPQTLVTGSALGASSVQLPGMDGAGTVYLPDYNGAGLRGIHVYATASLSSSNSSSQIISPPVGYLGCLQQVNGTTGAITCGTGANAAVNGPRNVLVDSTGSVWSGSSGGGVVQMIGLGAPAWPLLQSEKQGLAAGLTTPMTLP
jgi:hypothetical protein